MMRMYLVLSGIVFGAVALLHGLRLSFAWRVELDGWAAPLWLSWIGAFAAGALCVWAFVLLARQTP